MVGPEYLTATVDPTSTIARPRHNQPCRQRRPVHLRPLLCTFICCAHTIANSSAHSVAPSARAVARYACAVNCFYVTNQRACGVGKCASVDGVCAPVDVFDCVIISSFSINISSELLICCAHFVVAPFVNDIASTPVISPCSRVAKRDVVSTCSHCPRCSLFSRCPR